MNHFLVNPYSNPLITSSAMSMYTADLLQITFLGSIRFFSQMAIVTYPQTPPTLPLSGPGQQSVWLQILQQALLVQRSVHQRVHGQQTALSLITGSRGGRGCVDVSCRWLWRCRGWRGLAGCFLGLSAPFLFQGLGHWYYWRRLVGDGLILVHVHVVVFRVHPVPAHGSIRALLVRIDAHRVAFELEGLWHVATGTLHGQ